jgi:tetratricopeptide (TPR) repeat protein/transcriptional regulator with XRE-family HTH domain
MATAQPLPFGALLRRARRAAGLTQQALALRAGYSQVYVGMLERGERQPLPATVELLADALAVGPAERAALRRAAQEPHPVSQRLARASRAALQAPAEPPHLRPAALTPHALPLVDRAREVTLLRQHLAGHARPLLLLTGEPGIGKTRLLQEAALWASDRGWCALTGGCQRGGQEPYAPLLGALATQIHQLSAAQSRAALEGCAWLVRLLPELAELAVVPAPTWTLPPEQERRLMFAAVGRFLANIAGPAGTLLVLDDLQWACVDGLALLGALLRANPERPLRIVAAYEHTAVRHTDPLASWLADLAQDGLAAQETVTPLAADAAAELLDRALEGTAYGDEALRHSVLRRAGGVPFFLISFAEGLRAGALRAEAVAEGQVPWDIAQTIHQRVAALPDEAQPMVRIAAVASRVAPRELLVEVATRQGLAAAEALTGLDAACHAGLLVQEGADAYTFAHDLIREVVMADLGAAQRAHLHRELARALEREQNGHAIEAVAYHYREGGDPSKALVFLEGAGARAQNLRAPGAAENDYRDAFELARTLGDQAHEAEALEKLANVLFTVARFDQALEVLEQAAASYRAAADRDGEERALAQIGQIHLERRTPDEGIARLRPLFRWLEQEGLSPQGLADFCLMLAHLFFAGRHFKQTQAATKLAAKLAGMAQDQGLLGRVEIRQGTALQMLGRMDEAVRVVEDAARLCEATGDLRSLCAASCSLGDLYVRWGEFARALQHYERAHAAAEQLGDLTPIVFTTYSRGVTAYFLGDWVRARAEIERAVAMLDYIGVTWFSAAAHAFLGRMRLAQGEREAAIQQFMDAITLAERGRDLAALRQAQSALAEQELLEGRHQDALARLEPLLDPTSRTTGEAMAILRFTAWAHLEAGEVARAEELVLEGIVRATSRKLRPMLVHLLRVKALVELRRGADGRREAEAALEEALRLCRAMPYPYAEAKVLYTYGLAHAQWGEPLRARERFVAAQAILDRLGERQYAAHIERTLANLQG